MQADITLAIFHLGAYLIRVLLDEKPRKFQGHLRIAKKLLDIRSLCGKFDGFLG
jgi:hypothetical protein